MDGIHLSLSDRHAAFVDAQVASGGYPDASAYVAALIDATAREWAQEKLEQALLEGLNSPSIPWTTDSMEGVRREARSRL